MICPQCGYDMGNRNKCIRCGYEVKTLAVVDEDEHKKEEPDVKVIDPCNVYLTHPYGYEDDYGTGFGPMEDPFVSIIDSLFGGDPLTDLLGGLFGFDMSPRSQRTSRRQEQPQKKKKQGPIVVVDDVEIITDDNRNDEPDPPKRHDVPPQKKHNSIKNKFKKKKNNN